jgi:hypothetical protein
MFFFFFFFAAKRLRLPYLSAYLNSIGTNFKHGANFATGGSTIRRLNESFFANGVSPFSLEIQIVQFDQFKTRTSNLYNQGNTNMKFQPQRNYSTLIFISFIFVYYICSQETPAQKKSPKT